MPQVPNKVADRLIKGIKRFQPILVAAKGRDVNESDTVIIVTDMLSEVFGYDKYSEITSECAIRGTWCDLAIKLDGTIQLLLEVKEGEKADEAKKKISRAASRLLRAKTIREEKEIEKKIESKEGE